MISLSDTPSKALSQEERARRLCPPAPSPCRRVSPSPRRSLRGAVAPIPQSAMRRPRISLTR